MKQIRKALKYDLQLERSEGRKLFNKVAKEKDKDGNDIEKSLGIICDRDRRFYKLTKKFDHFR
jgi:hypothetical protein